jgi:phage gp36-like protein
MIMPYCLQADIEEQISQDELVELTDDSGVGVVDTSAVTRAIADADAEIDSYCGSRYTPPFDPVPVMIRKLSVDIAAYNLFSRRSALKIPNERQKRYENSIRFLRDVAKGLISLGADAPSEPDDSQPQTTRTHADRIFTSGKTSDGSVGTLDNY